MKLDPLANQPMIATERFDLRPPRVSDTGLVAYYAADARVAGMTSSIPHPLPPGTIEAFIDRSLSADRLEDVWVMDGTKTGAEEVMGVISLTRLDRAQSEVGYWVAPPYWNTGLASAAVAALVQTNPMDNAAMFASVFQDNPASAKVLTNCGFQYLGDAEIYAVARGAMVPTWTYSRPYAPR